MQDCEIIVDKFASAEWPPTEILIDGRSVDLAGIFAPTVRVVLVHGDGAMARDASLCRPAGLIDRMSACEACRRPSWHAHLFVVDQIDDAKRRPAGMLLDTNSPHHSVRLGRRRGCVVCWNAILKAGCGLDDAWTRQLYFRVVAHEIGHLFRLGHEESSSLMTPLAWFRGRRGYPDNLSWELSPAHRRQLAQTPLEALRPGCLHAGREHT